MKASYQRQPSGNHRVIMDMSNGDLLALLSALQHAAEPHVLSTLERAIPPGDHRAAHARRLMAGLVAAVRHVTSEILRQNPVTNDN